MARRSRGLRMVPAEPSAVVDQRAPWPVGNSAGGCPDGKGAVMAKSAFIGMVIKRGDQQYECVATRPYQRVDGKMTNLAIWRTNCPDCGGAFEVPCSMSMSRGPRNRRCLLHRAPGKRVERSSRAIRHRKGVSVTRSPEEAGVSGTMASSLPGDHEVAQAQGGAA